MKSLSRFVVLAVVALLTVGSAHAQPKDKVILMLNWYLYSEHAPFFLGKERGYYDQEGIELDIQEGRGSGVTVQAVAANTATFGYVDTPTMIKAAAKGAQTEIERGEITFDLVNDATLHVGHRGITMHRSTDGQHR